MSYQVLARKWRPRTFAEMAGQEHVLRALINALEQNRLHHAWLFTGTRGVGKTTIARILAKAINCERGVSATPCGECSACREIDEGRFIDLIEVDAASRTGVDDTRELLENVQYAPTRGRYKVYLIDEAHMFSKSSFNALLKTLEEPPPHVKFLLATTDPKKIPLTILSRCLQFQLKPLETERIGDYLLELLKREEIAGEEPAARLLARAADGSMRDALSLLDRAIAFGGGLLKEADVRLLLGSVDRQHLFDLLDALTRRDGRALLSGAERLAELGLDPADALLELTALLHRIAVLQALPDAPGDAEAETLRLSAALSGEEVQLFYQIALTGRRDMPFAANPRTGLEMTLLRMLAFRPAETGESARASASSGAPAQPRGAPTAPPAAHSAPAPTSTPAPVSMPTPASTPAASPRSDEETWAQIVSALRLTGLAGELAKNSMLRAREGARFTLETPARYAHLRSANAEQRLREALSAHCGSEAQLDIRATEGAEETLAAHARRRRGERLTAARESLENDPTVQSLLNAFNGASITPPGVELIEPDGRRQSDDASPDADSIGDPLNTLERQENAP